MDQMDRTDFMPARSVLLALILVAAGCGGDDDSDDTLAPVPTATVTTTTAAAPTTVTSLLEPTTSTAPATSPAPTEPATVAPTDAPTTTATPDTTATTAAPTTTVAPVALTLGRDGLGVVTFGTEAEPAIAAVSAALGAPTEDTGWVDPITISNCAGEELRRVSWGTLSLLFGDPAGSGSGRRQFFASSYGSVAELGGAPEGLRTPEGLGLGATVAQLRGAYPQVQITPGEEGLIEPSFYVDDNLSGLLTGDADTDAVTVIFGGPFCG
jgi:hypothetical protein